VALTLDAWRGVAWQFNGYTPLLHAAVKGFDDVARLLLEASADMEATTVRAISHASWDISKLRYAATNAHRSHNAACAAVEWLVGSVAGGELWA